MVDVVLNPGEGIDLEITYELHDVGRVIVTAYVENDETGALSIILDRTIVADIAFAEGHPTELEFSQDLHPSGALMLASSIGQIFQSERVRDALLRAGQERWVCWLAGKMAGAVAGILTAGTCTAVAGPLAPGCFAPGSLGFKSVDNYVAGKCHKAQNPSRGWEDHV